MKINEVAKLTGITVRTLHYYDEIGLLKPSSHTDSNYRIYSLLDVEILQQILFFKELDFSLVQIKSILNNQNYEKNYALSKQRDLLLEKKHRLDGLITLLDDILEGENKMSFKQFDNSKVEEMKSDYEKEVKERFGKTKAYSEYEEKTSNYVKEDFKVLEKKCNEIFADFSKIKDDKPDSEIAQNLVYILQEFITNNYYKCDKNILLTLGQMYVEDIRFKQNIDKNGDGTAKFVLNAIEYFCK